jgi:large subunit ribosomal protein L28
VGNQITIRGKAKYLGGVGTKVTGISRRQFKPNLQRVKVTMAGANKTINACTQCIRSGLVTKTVRAAPFRLPASTTTRAKGASAVGGKPGKPIAPKPAAAKKPQSSKSAKAAKAAPPGASAAQPGASAAQPGASALAKGAASPKPGAAPKPGKK